MKAQKNIHHSTDDSLFGLLAAYKVYYTYVRVLFSEETRTVVLQITSDPGNWYRYTGEEYKGFRPLSRLDIGLTRFFVKFVRPFDLVRGLGPYLGITVDEKKIKVIDHLTDAGIYSVEVSSRYKKNIVHAAAKLVRLTSRKKYEILEKSLSGADEMDKS